MPTILRRTTLCCLLVLGGCLLGPFVVAQQPSSGSADSQAKEKAAIRQAGEKYLAAVRGGDAKQVAACWTEDGNFIDAEGQSFQGRDLAKEVENREKSQELGQELPKLNTSIRLIAQDVAIEDGEVLGGDRSGRFTAVWVKREGRWLLDTVREAHVPKASPHDHLRPLSWMVGNWRAVEGEVQVEVTCLWSDDMNFLIREIQVKSPESQPMSIHQRIGWDAALKQVKSWTFDSHGGHGEGLWSHEKDRWQVITTAVHPDGQKATSRNLYTPQEDGSVLWESTQAAVEGEETPDQKLRLVRVSASE